MKNVVFWMLRRVAVVKTSFWQERIASIIMAERVLSTLMFLPKRRFLQ
jgi:hypothetical protein